MPAPSKRLTWAETRRKVAHMAAFWPALFLPWMTPGQALGVAFLLLLMNLFILPWAAKGLYRAEETGLGALEVVLYPAALMACVIAFGFVSAGARGLHAWYLPVGAAWFALACVDACIGFACRILPGGPALPWNGRKPILGVVLGTLASLPPAYALARLALPPLSGTQWAALLVLVLIAAAAETAWFGVADNLVIPFFLCVSIPLFAGPWLDNPLWAQAGGLQPWFTSLDASGAMGAANGMGAEGPERLGGLGRMGQLGLLGLYWLAVPVAFGALTWIFRLLTPGGAVLGGLLSLLLILAEPWLFLFLGGFFALGNAATRVGFARKQALGIAEARGGRRGAAEVFGAMGMAAWMTPLVHLAHGAHQAQSALVADFHRALLVCIAPLVAKTMDTVSSEIGKAVGGKTISLRSFRLVAPGTDGGVSLAGTLCGLAAAALMALAILPLGWGSLLDAAALLSIAVLANLFESYWGEYATRRGMDQGPHTNVLMTLAAAVLAWLCFIGSM
jgi:uncharacterized protein (TIGR00297 family)